MAGHHPARDLWLAHHQVEPYPEGVVGVEQAIPGTAFFPGGYGLWRPTAGPSLPPWPLRGVMVLGHDFHSEVGYRESLARGREAETQPTWRNLTKLLDQAKIPLTDCFFTNVYMGLRAGTETTGPFPGLLDPAFEERCLAFLGEQLVAQQPRLILTLGKPAIGMLSRLSEDLRGWREARSFREIDRGGAVAYAVAFWGCRQTTVVPLIHPSLRHASIRYRRYRDLKGESAELAMIANGLGQP